MNPNPTHNYEHELDVALAAAALAGEFIRREYESFTPIANAPVDISTHVDKGSQEIILTHLRTAFPDDGLCAEEDTATLQLSSKVSSESLPRRVWVVDPIDGTRGFVMKNGEFSVMIGLTVNGVPVVGVVLEPVTMRWTYATLGGGCWTRLEDSTSIRCTVHRMADPEACVLVQSHAKPGKPSPMEAALMPAKTLSMYSAGVKLAVVARGEGDVYVNNYTNFKDWDICAGHLLVTEAGGVVVGTRGEVIGYGAPKFEQKSGLVAGPKQLVEAILPKLANLM